MERLEKLLEYRRKLAEEEQNLKRTLVQIEEQVHVLQIEQLHLIGMLKKSTQTPAANKSITEPEVKLQELDLSVPLHMKVYTEEEEEEEGDDDDSQVGKK